MKPKPITVPPTDEGKAYFRSLIASMIGDTPLFGRLRKDITGMPFVKGTYVFERSVLDALKLCSLNGILPTKENVLKHMIESMRYDPKVAEEGLRIILEQRIEVPENGDPTKRQNILENNMNGALADFDMWFSLTVHRDAYMAALAELDNPTQPFLQRIQNASQIVTNYTSPLAVVEFARHEDQELSLIQEQERRLAGQEFPDTPFPQLNELIGTFIPGDPMTLSGTEGSGKSTLADIFGEWVAFQHGIYVCSVVTETKMSSYGKRAVARHFGIPSVVFDKDIAVNLPGQSAPLIVPRVDFKNPFWDDIIGKKKFAEMLERKNIAKGEFVRVRRTNASMKDVLALAMQEKSKAERKGMQFMLIVDYLQKLVWSTAPQDQWSAITVFTAEFKDFCDKHQIYGILLSQETQDENGKTRAYGGRSVAMQTQQHISLRRPKLIADPKSGAAIEKEYLVDSKGIPIVNGIGMPRHMAIKDGDISGKQATLEVIKVNQGTQGTCPIWFEGALYNAYVPGQVPLYPLVDIGALRKHQRSV